MRHFQILPALLLATAIFSCKKESNTNTNCFDNTSTIRQIANAQATIKLANGKFYIVEQSAIDTRLNPCSLATEFRVNDLQVTISGDVKQTVQGGPEPCCLENFVITKISR